MDAIPIEELITHYNEQKYNYFFRDEVMKLFGTQLEPQAYRTSDNSMAFFVTSEKSCVNAPLGRRWTVRGYNYQSKRIQVYGVYQGYENAASAIVVAKGLALDFSPKI